MVEGVSTPPVRRCCLHSLPTSLDSVGLFRDQTLSECNRPAAKMAPDLEPLTRVILVVLRRSSQLACLSESLLPERLAHPVVEMSHRSPFPLRSDHRQSRNVPIHRVRDPASSATMIQIRSPAAPAAVMPAVDGSCDPGGAPGSYDTTSSSRTDRCDCQPTRLGVWRGPREPVLRKQRERRQGPFNGQGDGFSTALLACCPWHPKKSSNGHR